MDVIGQYDAGNDGKGHLVVCVMKGILQDIERALGCKDRMAMVSDQSKEKSSAKRESATVIHKMIVASVEGAISKNGWVAGI